MKQTIVTISLLLLFSGGFFAQNNIEKVLSEVEKNNTMLVALRKNAEAEKLNNKSGLSLENPEAEFNYLWGDPSSIGNRKDLSIGQSFDFPTAYVYRNQISKSQNKQVELEYEKQRKSIILQTRLLCIDLIYSNALTSELSSQLANAKSIAHSYKRKYELGEVNILEYNKSQLNLLNTTKEIETLELESEQLRAQLTQMNGGTPIAFSDSIFQPQPIPDDFDQWYAVAEQINPVLQWLKQEISISQKQVKLNTAMSLPKFQAGYMSESVVGETFQGVSVGISIPLWENKNTVKYAKAKSIAIQNEEINSKLKFSNHLKSLHSKAIGLQKSAADYEENLILYSNSALLMKALEKGEISLIDYMQEVSVYFDSTKNLLQMKQKLNKTIAELLQFM